MPFLDGSTPEKTPQVTGIDPQAYVPPELNITSDAGDVARDFLRYENTVGSFARHMGERWSLYYAQRSGWAPIDDDDYDPFEDGDVLALVNDRPEVAQAFSQSSSRYESGLIRRRIADEDAARETMANAGAGGVATMLAMGLIDPVNLLPVGTGFRALQTGRIAKGALEGGTAGLAAGGVSEAVLQSTQTTRTAEESIANMAASTVLSAVLGGGLGLVSSKARDPMAAALAREMQDAHAAFVGELQGGGGSGGAAAARATTMGDETRVPTGVRAERAGELPVVGNPMGRLSASPSIEARRVARDLTETAYRYQGDTKGIASPQAVETRVKTHEGPLASALGMIDDAFSVHRFGQKVFAAKTRAGFQDITGQRSPQKLTHQQFMERVGYAMRRDDVDTIPEVAAAAKIAREVVERLKNLAIKHDQLPPDIDVKTAWSYLTRVYNTEKIKAQRPQFEAIAYEWLGGLRESAKERVEQVNSWAKLRDKARENIPRVEAELKKQADLDIPELRQKGAEARKLANQLRREMRVREDRVAALKRRLATAQRRQVRVTDRLPETHELVQDLENARTAKEPQRIIERVREMGGLKDAGGELKARGFKPIKTRNGKPIKSKDWRIEIIDPEATAADARGLDQVARQMAEEDGFLPRKVDTDGAVEDPHIDDLLDALDQDAHGSPVYAEFGKEAELVARWRDAENFKAELERQEISIDWANERIAAELGLIEDYVPNTPGARARFREAGFYERRVSDDLASEQKSLDEALQKLIKAETDARDKLAVAGRLRERRDALLRERSASKRQAEKFTKLVDSERELQVLSDADLRDVARQITDKVLGHENAGAMDIDGTANLRGSLLERSFTIPDVRIEPYLESNIETVLRKYTRQMGADVELAATFGRPDMMDQFDEIRQAYGKVRDSLTAPRKDADGKIVNPEPDEKALAALDRRMKNDIEDLATIRDIIRGTYGVPKDPEQMMVRGFRVARGLNYLRLMGGATLASLADPGAIVMSHGMSRVFGKPGMKAFVASLKATRQGMGLGGKGHAAADEVRRSGTAGDLVLDTRARNLAEIGDDWGRGSKFERGLQWAQNKFGLANALSIWTSFWKQFDGVVAQTRILEAAERLADGKATKSETEYLSWLGIDYDMATRLNKQQGAHATIEPGYRTANTLRWNDPEAVQALRAALVKDVDTSVVTPGAGDRPSWTRTEWGKTIAQFKSFSLSAMARTTARGLQQRDIATVQGMTMMVVLGMLQYYIRTRDEDIDWENPAVWIKEGVDRSGVTGWIFEAMNTQEKILGGLGINAAIGSPSARYASRNATGAILGPTFGVGEDAIRLLSNIGKGEWSAADTHRIRKLLPAQNLMYLRWMFDQLEEGVNETFGVPDRRQKFKRRNDY